MHHSQPTRAICTLPPPSPLSDIASTVSGHSLTFLLAPAPPSPTMVYAPLLFYCGFLGLTGVIAGAFSAHGLDADDKTRAAFTTAAHYQMVQSLAALVSITLAELLSVSKPAAATRLKVAAWLLVIGATLFAGTIYVMALGVPKQLGILTPIGGIVIMLGWCCEMVAAFAL